jgi:hypothetical protein
MKKQNSISTIIAGTNHYNFNFPDIGDKVILIHNPFNTKDENAIMVINSNLQQIGHLSRIFDFNKNIGCLIDWKPYTATVTLINTKFLEIQIEIDLKPFKKNAMILKKLLYT